MRASRASLPSLLAISAAFFLPFVKGCERMVSPVGLITSEWPRFFPMTWVVPRFATAALLFAITVVALYRHRAPGRAGALAATLGLVSMLPASVVDGWELLRHPLRFDLAQLGAAATIFGLGGLGIWWAVRAWRHQGWARWERLIGAYAALAAPFAWIAVETLPQGWRDVGLGGYAYLTGILTLLTLRALDAHAAKCRT